MQRKLDSNVLRLGLIALIGIISKEFINYELPNEVVNGLVEVLLYLTTFVAILNNPNNPNKF